MGKYYKEDKICPTCDKVFKAWRSDTVSCSHTCSMKLYQSRNKETVAETKSIWRSNNRGKDNASKSKYRAAKRNATVSWADEDLIEMWYTVAAIFKEEVDHIVPLQSDKVCGLHCPDNFQLLSKTDNSSKNNKWEIS